MICPQTYAPCQCNTVNACYQRPPFVSVSPPKPTMQEIEGLVYKLEAAVETSVLFDKATNVLAMQEARAALMAAIEPGKCKDCQHWGRDGECGHPKMQNTAESPDGAMGDSANHGPHIIATGPDFGCIHFEKKR